LFFRFQETKVNKEIEVVKFWRAAHRAAYFFAGGDDPLAKEQYANNVANELTVKVTGYDLQQVKDITAKAGEQVLAAISRWVTNNPTRRR
jgi:hypothetical protein